ncbi:heterodisulfide reductase-related iron-sulfur binding cluster [Gordonia sinesedis]
MTSTTIAIGTITTLISLYCWAVFGRAIWTMVHTIAQGEKVNSSRFFPILPRIRNVIVEVGAHTRMNKFRTVGWAHWLVMVGFLLGFVFVFEAYGQAFNPEFHWPWLGTWPPYVLAEEILGWGTVIGIIALIIIRQLNHPRVPERLSRFSGSNFRAAYFIEIVVLIEGIGMLGVKLFKIASGIESPPVWEAPTLYYLAKPLEGIPEWSVSVMAVLKLLSAMIWLAVVSRNITWGVAWHRFSAFFNIYLKKNADGAVALGPLIPMMSNGKVIDLEDADPDTQTFGAGKIEDFSWKGWLDFTTCTECGRCQSQCPAWNTGKPLSPKLLITSLRDQGYAVAPYLMAGGGKDMGGDEVGLVDADGNVDEKKLAAVPQSARDAAERPLVGESEGSSGGGVIDTETLWSCTTCGACVEQCPVDIEHVDHIVNMRRYQVLIESDFPTELAGMFKNLETKGNPWGQNASARTNWIDEMDLEIPVFGKDVDSFEGFEYLFWVGCAGAYEDRAKKTTKAVAELLDIAAVNFLVLGEGETCTGDPARRAGNEFLFQMLAQQNIEMFGELFSSAPEQRKKIVVTCAHCFNTLYNEYPQVGGDDAKYEVVHHTQLLNKLVREKRLVPVAPINEGVTYHDPCYLGRHNHIYSAPRELMDASGSQLTEMPRHGTRSMCCGAGGARMWMEENIGKRINIDRVDEALDVLDHDKAEASGTQKIATGCPFCRVMLTDGVTAQTSGTEREGKVEVVDVAQLLLEAVSRGATPVARGGRFLGPVSKPEPEPGEPATAEPVAAQAATDTATAEAPSAAGTQAKPKVGLGMKGGAKRPGAAAKAASGAAPATGAAAAAADGGSAPAAEAPAAEKKPAAKGFGMKGGAKRPGAAKSAPAADAPPAETTPAAEATAAEPAESVTASTPAEKKPAAKGFGMGAGAKRPGAKRPGAAKAASEPTADTAAEPAGGDAVSESVTEVSVTEETVVDAPATGGAAVTEEKPAKAKGFGMAAGKKRPGGGGSGKPAAAASPAPAESPAETSDSAATEAPEPAAAETAATDEAPAAATPATGGAALTEEKPAKAKGFGMAAGKKRPGGGGSGAAAGSPAPSSGADEAAPQAEPTAEARPAATDAVTDAAPSEPAGDEPAGDAESTTGSDGGTDAESAGGDSSARTIGEAGASKAKGFGIAAGKKRPGHR